MVKKYDDPKIGDRFGSLSVSSVRRTTDKKGWTIRKISLLCDCGATVTDINISTLYGVSDKRPVTECRRCSYIRRGHNMRSNSEAPNKKKVFLAYKNNAKRRKIHWGLLEQEFYDIVCLPCVYCRSTKQSFLNPSKQNPGSLVFRYTGVDRIDSDGGYTLDNINSCCKICNNAKSTMSELDFLNWIEKVYSCRLKNG